MPSTSYNDHASKMSMNLYAVYEDAAGMATDLQAVNDAWTDTMNRWNALKLSWAGQTQQEVDSFQKDLDKVQKEIFGTAKPDPKDPSQQVTDQPGLYQVVGDLAAGAVQNYNWTDFAVATRFYQMSATISGNSYDLGAGPDGTAVQIQPQADAGQVSNHTDPYISETFA